MAGCWRSPVFVLLVAAAVVSGCGTDRASDLDTGDTAADGGDGDGDGDGDVDWAACDVPSDCVLSFNTCCGTCGVPTLDDYDAINWMEEAAHYAEVCTEPDPICPNCASAPNPWLTATCADATCAELDLETHPLNTCEVDADCRIRTPSCCECGAPTDVWSLIAVPVEAEAELTELLCDPDLGCPECAPVYPDELSAVCTVDGRCAVEGL